MLLPKWSVFQEQRRVNPRRCRARLPALVCRPRLTASKRSNVGGEEPLSTARLPASTI